MQMLWSVLLTRLFSGLAMVFPSPLNTVKTDDRCVNVWSVPVRVLMVVMCTARVHIQWRRKEIIVGGALRVLARGGYGRGAPLPPS